MQNSSHFADIILVTKGATFEGKNLLSRESKFFPSRVAPYNKGGKYYTDQTNLP